MIRVPEWDRRSFPALPGLHSRLDVAALRRQFASLTVIAGADATAPRVLAQIPRHELAYFEGHSLAADRGSRRSGLVLAPVGSGDDGLLSPEKIRLRAPVATRLAVLGSCSGAGGTLSPTEGPLSLVRPFLAAGVPTVIASLGSVEDTASDALFQGIVRGLRDHQDPAELLRRSQLAASRSASGHGGLLFSAYGSPAGVFRH